MTDAHGDMASLSTNSRPPNWINAGSHGQTCSG